MRKFSQLITAVGAIATFAVAAPAQAQYDEHLIAHVPFAFSVGTAALPSATYDLTRMNGHREMLVLRGDRGGIVMISHSGAYSIFVNPAPYSLSGRKRFHNLSERAFALSSSTTGVGCQRSPRSTSSRNRFSFA